MKTHNLEQKKSQSLHINPICAHTERQRLTIWFLRLPYSIVRNKLINIHPGDPGSYHSLPIMSTALTNCRFLSTVLMDGLSECTYARRLSSGYLMVVGCCWLTGQRDSRKVGSKVHRKQSNALEITPSFVVLWFSVTSHRSICGTRSPGEAYLSTFSTTKSISSDFVFHYLHSAHRV